MKNVHSWFVYILQCANGALYTGIAVDVKKRLQVHNSGKGSRYVRAHRPARLFGVYASESQYTASSLGMRDQGHATQLEAATGRSMESDRNLDIPKYFSNIAGFKWCQVRVPIGISDP